LKILKFEARASADDDLKSRRVSNLTHRAHVNQSPIGSRSSEGPRDCGQANLRTRAIGDDVIKPFPFRELSVFRGSRAAGGACAWGCELGRGEKRGPQRKFITNYHFYHLSGTLNHLASQYHDYGCVRRLRRHAGADTKRAPGDGREVGKGLDMMVSQNATKWETSLRFRRSPRIRARAIPLRPVTDD
jgi:hypothetical protein